MFKVQKVLKSMDFNKNTEKYKFNPISTINTTKLRIKQMNDYNNLHQNFQEATIKSRSKFPPIYFYRKISNPYKYNISSVPKYLIKSNEEKRFMDKLYKSITDEKDKNTLRDLLDKNKKKVNFRKDNFKPNYLDVQKILRYQPNLFNKMSDPLLRNKTKLKKSSDTYEEKPKDISIENNMVVNSCPNNERYGKSTSTALNDNNKITNEEQIKFKYTLSDIFNMRKEPIFLNKSAEKYLFKNHKYKSNDLVESCPNKTYTSKNITNNDRNKDKEENLFYTSSESKSDWIPNKINSKTMGTNSSVSYNILCPMYTGTNRFITASELNKNNLYNESTAFRRVKSISEFIDLTRVSATNTLGCFDRKMKIPNFKINNSIGTNQLDAYHINRDLLEKYI